MYWISSCTVLAGTDGLTVIDVDVVAKIDAGTSSLAAS